MKQAEEYYNKQNFIQENDHNITFSKAMLLVFADEFSNDQNKELIEAGKIDSELVDFLYDKIHEAYENLFLGHYELAGEQLSKLIKDQYQSNMEGYSESQNKESIVKIKAETEHLNQGERNEYFDILLKNQSK